MTNPTTKRARLIIDCSPAFKAEYERQVKIRYVVGNPKELVSIDVRSLIEQDYPPLADLSRQERPSSR